MPFYGVVLAIGAAATTYEVRYMLPLELLFPVLLLYSISCAKRADVPKEREKKEGRLSSELSVPHWSRRGTGQVGEACHFNRKNVSGSFPLAKSGLAPILLPP